MEMARLLLALSLVSTFLSGSGGLAYARNTLAKRNGEPNSDLVTIPLRHAPRKSQRLDKRDSRLSSIGLGDALDMYVSSIKSSNL